LGALARKDWLVNGDRNTRYFHQTMKARKSRSAIIRIKDSSRVWIDDPVQLQHVFVNDSKLRFKSAHGSSSIRVDLPTRVSEVENENLIKPVEDFEIKEAIFQMDKFKALGSDGFGAAFYQYHWPTIQMDVCSTVKLFFQDGKLLKQLNHTLIALIPKVANPTTTVQFRPISLCNRIYKIIAKILVNRMRPLLVNLIDPT